MHEEVSIAEPEREGDDSRASGARVAGNERRYFSPFFSLLICELMLFFSVALGESPEPEPEPPKKPKLAEDETIINPYYMRQLLQYGIKLGQQKHSADLSPEDLLREATVRLLPRSVHLVF